ncbi:MAG: LAGLIDADG family homing endonuclease, partial [Nitrososphaerales archaeon]
MCEKLSSLGFRPYIRTRRHMDNHLTVYELSFDAIALAKWLDENVGCNMHNRSVPKILFHVSKDIKQAYLEGLFTGGGSCTHYGYRLTSVSTELLYGIQILL